jgi:uncharacterized coiled-coil DUF342 family protein
MSAEINRIDERIAVLQKRREDLDATHERVRDQINNEIYELREKRAQIERITKEEIAQSLQHPTTT